MINVIGWRLDDIVQIVRGEEGTIIKLEIENEEEGILSKLKEARYHLKKVMHQKDLEI